MSTTKKVLTIVFTILIVGAFAFVLTWGIINWSKVKDGMAGNGLYTQNDVHNAYEDGYSTALTDKEAYDKLINEYRDTITTQNDLMSQLNSEVLTLTNGNRDCKTQINTLTEQKAALETQIETLNTVKTNNENTIADLHGQIDALNGQVLTLTANKDENANTITALNGQIANLQTLNTQLQETNELNVKTINGLNAQIVGLNNQISELTLQMQNNSATVNTLNAKIAELQKSISYYEQYLSNLETGEQVVATFEFAGSVYNIQVVGKNSLVTVTTPQSTAYVIFNGWTVDGAAVDLSSYRITANTKFVADVTYKYEVNFTVDGANYNNQIVLKDSKVTAPTAPSKTGYVFDGWTLDGNSVVNLSNYPITANTTFTAKFTKLYSVVFKYEDTTLKNETVKSGQYATAPETNSTAYKVFNGWKVNGSAVDVSNYRITADTVFVADITYKYDVKFIADGKTHNSQIVERNGKPTVPTAPSKTNYTFAGWSIDGTATVDVSKHIVTENTTFTAIFNPIMYTVTFKDGTTTLSTQQVQQGSAASTPTSPTKSGHTFLGWSKDGTNTVDVSKQTITANTTFTALFRVDKYTVTFKNGNTTVATQEVSNGGYATIPDFDTDTFMGWMVNGSVVDIATYKITANTTFTAKFGTWKQIYDDMAHVSSNAGDKKIEISVAGLKKGDKIKLNFANIKVNDGRQFAGGGYNNWNGFAYVGYDGNFTENPEWFEYGETDYFGNQVEPNMMDKDMSSMESWTTTVGRLDWSQFNEMTISISCKQDGVLTIEWTDDAGFYISEAGVWMITVLR